MTVTLLRWEALAPVVRIVLLAVAVGVALMGFAGPLPGSQGLNALSWFGTVATIAAFIVAIGIYRVQRSD